jgi:hypothetical protein
MFKTTSATSSSQEYFQLILKVHQSKYEILFEEASPKFSDAKSQLAYMVNKLKADYCFLGSFGRKGAQNDKYRVGHTAIKLATESKVPIVVVSPQSTR